MNIPVKKVLLLTLCLGAIAFGQDTTRQLTVDQAKTSDKRTALIIGNANYQVARKLANPVNDAVDVTAALKDLGFEVVSGTDLTLRQMREKVREFGDKLKTNGGVGLFYYAGHGVQVNGTNYLIPIDADIPREDEVIDLAFRLDSVFDKMTTANNGFNIIILDACRNNPFARSWSRGSGTDGLAQVNAPTGTFIAYATDVNKTADDGTGRNGLYTEQLLGILNAPGKNIEEVFKDIRRNVVKASSGRQVPWTSSSFMGDFYFRKDSGAEIVVKAKTMSEQEIETWEMIKKSANVAALRQFIKEFPDSTRIADVNIRLEEAAWAEAKSENTQEAVNAFLSEFPTGANAGSARVLAQNLKPAKAVTGAKVPNPMPTNMSNFVAATRTVKPEFPKEARGLKGSVTVQITLDKKGNVTNATPMAGPVIFFRAAEKAAMDSKFTPVMENGRPAQVVRRFAVNFDDGVTEPCKDAPLNILMTPKPGYSKSAEDARIKGSVVLMVTFLENGEIGQIHEETVLGGGLTEMALGAAKRIAFIPACQNGKRINVSKRFEYEFGKGQEPQDNNQPQIQPRRRP